jgi:hypothetical protein
MSIILAAALAASSHSMPWIDRTWLNDRAKIEVLSPRAASLNGVRAASSRPAKALLSSNLRVLGTVCSAAARLSNPGAFLDELGSAYAMSPREISTLRENCAIYLSGRSDGR